VPYIRCGKDKKGTKWGKTGKCYSSKKKASKQRVAITLSKLRKR